MEKTFGIMPKRFSVLEPGGWSTGRLVQIYGQWTKDGQIIRVNSLKKKIDHLSTLYATFSILRKWL